MTVAFKCKNYKHVSMCQWCWNMCKSAKKLKKRFFKHRMDDLSMSQLADFCLPHRIYTCMNVCIYSCTYKHKHVPKCIVHITLTKFSDNFFFKFKIFFFYCGRCAAGNYSACCKWHAFKYSDTYIHMYLSPQQLCIWEKLVLCSWEFQLNFKNLTSYMG